MKFERFFFPLIVVSAVASVYVALRSGKSAATIIASNSPQSILPPSLSSVSSPAQSGTFTQQAQQSVPWYISYNFNPLPPQLPINNLASSGSGCGTCGNTQYV